MTAGCESILHESATTSGTVEFLADGTFRRDQMSNVRYTLSVPDTCGTSSCAELQASIQKGIAAHGNGTADCAESGGSCSCHIDATSVDSGAGSYEVNGSLVTFTLDPNANASMTNYFCVSGDTLTLHQQGQGSLLLSRE